ncbi:dCTP deaminase [Salinirubrum litoreum]|uniref:dCTP deaminase n=1 Tax=Salinirubrum litoreum TaxID=1126234 RepID=A0ABD5RG17_9EURY|nr:dCTP deaminase [Salinirubrum litoreum]
MDLTSVVADLVHEPIQTESRGLDLTVAEVRKVVDPGRIDFGGGELTDATTEPVETDLRNPDDDYGWWHLSNDVYLLEYNESLAGPGDVNLVLQPRDELRTRGAFHPTLHLAGDDDFGAVPLSVSNGGLMLKENARVSTLLAD